jgi:hypothetical protein
MKVQNTHSGNMVINLNSKNTDEQTGKASSEKDKKSSQVIFAGDMKLNSNQIDQKKQQAHKSALKKIMDQYKNDLNMDDTVSELKDKSRELTEEIKFSREQINGLDASTEDIKKTYGITDDSAEQKDLKLLEKSMFTNDKLSEDEQKQLASMGSLTDYQKAALKNDSMKEIWKSRIDSANDGIIGIGMSIDDISLAKLKSHPMVDAQKEAMKIIEDASKQVTNALLQQGKEEIDKKMDENKEKVHKEQEKNQEEKEKLEKSKKTSQTPQSTEETKGTDNQGSDHHDADTQRITELQQDQNQLLDDLKHYADKNSLTLDDLKGIVVDEQI